MSCISSCALQVIPAAPDGQTHQVPHCGRFYDSNQLVSTSHVAFAPFPQTCSSVSTLAPS
jgi:hypothetical protein